MISSNAVASQLRYTLFRFLIVLFMTCNVLIAQNHPNAAANQSVVNDNSTLHEIQKATDDYWKSKNVKNGVVEENGVETKVPGWKLYKRWEYFWEQRTNSITGEFPKTNSVIEFDKYREKQKSLKKGKTYNESWINLGTNLSSGGYAGLGRINCVAFHPTDNNTFWVGSPSGGIWKTTNGGSNWTILNNDQAVLGVSDIAIPSDYATSNTLYIATGDRDGGSMWSLSGGQAADNVSVGVLKSTDGGATWNTTGLSYAKNLGKKVYSLLVHPATTSILFASTSDGIYKTTDGGGSWAKKTGSYPGWRIAFKPGDPNTMYGTETYSGDQWFQSSTDGGETWSDYQIGSGATSYRSELAVSPADPTVVYLLTCNTSGGLEGVYKSTDDGASFSRVDDGTKSMLGYYSDGSGANSGQGSYDLTIACSPSDINTLYIGGVNTWKSTDGGATWTISNMWTSYAGYNFSGAPVAHADKHVHAFQNSTTLFEGNDGGIYKTTNGGTTWTDLSNGLVISQIYRLGVSQTDANVILTGLQDNGSKKYRGALNTWYDATGGDGMECIIDFNNATSYMYATYVRGTIYRNSNGFSTTLTTTISANIPGGQPTGAWVTPYIMNPLNSATLFAGYDQVWKTTDRGTSWTSASQQLSATDKLRSLAIAPSDSNVLYAGDRTHLWKTTDGGATAWTSITLPITSIYLTYIAVKNNDPNTVWITFGGYTDSSKVYESTNGGQSWTNISTGLPNLPVMSVVYYKDVLDRNVLFCGTDIGVYVKDGTNNWTTYNAGLPNVVVTELEIFYTAGTDKLRAATFGRGLWETDINTPLPVEISFFGASYKNNSVQLNWTTATEVNNYGFEIERKNKNDQASTWGKIGSVKGNGNSNSPKNYSYEDRTISYGPYLYRLKQIDNSGQFSYSDIVEVFPGSVLTGFALGQNYPNPFNPRTTITYALSTPDNVSLKVYDYLGREVATLVNEYKSVGEHRVDFDATNLASGIYLYRIKVGNNTSIKRMLLLK